MNQKFIFIQLNNLNMNQKRQNILNIQFHIQKGLIFSWNLRGLLNEQTYFRHLFIFNSNDQIFLENVSNLIYSKIKIGDFIGVYCKKSAVLDNSLEWFEKTSFSFESLRFKGVQRILTKQLIKALPQIAKEASGYFNPIMANIFTDQVDEIPKIKDCIEKLRIDGFFPFHVNFFADFSFHDISVSTGFNCINTTKDSLAEVSRIYKSLSLESAVMNMQMEISCPNVQLATRKDKIWECVDFGQVRRSFYGPSVHYTQDFISFYDETHSKGGILSMIISLKITLLSGKALNAEKSFTLTTKNIRMYGMTKCENNEPRSTYQFSKAIRSQTQPYCSTSQLIIVKFVTQEQVS